MGIAGCRALLPPADAGRTETENRLLRTEMRTYVPYSAVLPTTLPRQNLIRKQFVNNSFAASVSWQNGTNTFCIGRHM